jgi:signal transduction histidine kinase
MNTQSSFKIEIIKLIVPSLLAVVLFAITIFGIALPNAQKNLLDQKKEMIVSLTQTAWNVLSYYDQLVKSGELPLETAKERTIKVIKYLRYGEVEKDYFWINDLQPKMIMHPYRSDLDGQDLSTFTDPKGKRLFIEFVNEVKKKGGGFVPYVWQWKDDPTRLVPKLSYVKLFQPWGWIIGTGVYLEDVDEEMRQITRKLLLISLGILFLIILLSGYIIGRGLKENRRRRTAEKALEEYQHHLEELVERRTADLKKALEEVKVLSGFLPICSSCKQIRDDQGYWNQIESYIKKHSNAEFSHSLCPDCVKKLYPDLEEDLYQE